MLDWMYWVTAIVFTVVGFSFGMSFSKEIITAATIEALIKQGYLKTKGTGSEKQVVKYDE